MERTHSPIAPVTQSRPHQSADTGREKLGTLSPANDQHAADPDAAFADWLRRQIGHWAIAIGFTAAAVCLLFYAVTGFIEAQF